MSTSTSVKSTATHLTDKTGALHKDAKAVRCPSPNTTEHFAARSLKPEDSGSSNTESASSLDNAIMNDYPPQTDKSLEQQEMVMISLLPRSSINSSPVIATSSVDTPVTTTGHVNIPTPLSLQKSARLPTPLQRGVHNEPCSSSLLMSVYSDNATHPNNLDKDKSGLPILGDNSAVEMRHSDGNNNTNHCESDADYNHDNNDSNNDNDDDFGDDDVIIPSNVEPIRSNSGTASVSHTASQVHNTPYFIDKHITLQDHHISLSRVSENNINSTQHSHQCDDNLVKTSSKGITPSATGSIKNNPSNILTSASVMNMDMDITQASSMAARAALAVTSHHHDHNATVKPQGNNGLSLSILPIPQPHHNSMKHSHYHRVLPRTGALVATLGPPSSSAFSPSECSLATRTAGLSESTTTPLSSSSSASARKGNSTTSGIGNSSFIAHAIQHTQPVSRTLSQQSLNIPLGYGNLSSMGGAMPMPSMSYIHGDSLNTGLIGLKLTDYSQLLQVNNSNNPYCGQSEPDHPTAKASAPVIDNVILSRGNGNNSNGSSSLASGVSTGDYNLGRIVGLRQSNPSCSGQAAPVLPPTDALPDLSNPSSLHLLIPSSTTGLDSEYLHRQSLIDNTLSAQIISTSNGSFAHVMRPFHININATPLTSLPTSLSTATTTLATKITAKTTAMATGDMVTPIEGVPNITNKSSGIQKADLSTNSKATLDSKNTRNDMLKVIHSGSDSANGTAAPEERARQDQHQQHYTGLLLIPANPSGIGSMNSLSHADIDMQQLSTESHNVLGPHHPNSSRHYHPLHRQHHRHESKQIVNQQFAMHSASGSSLVTRSVNDTVTMYPDSLTIVLQNSHRNAMNSLASNAYGIQSFMIPSSQMHHQSRVIQPYPQVVPLQSAQHHLPANNASNSHQPRHHQIGKDLNRMTVGDGRGGSDDDGNNDPVNNQVMRTPVMKGNDKGDLSEDHLRGDMGYISLTGPAHHDGCNMSYLYNIHGDGMNNMGHGDYYAIPYVGHYNGYGIDNGRHQYYHHPSHGHQDDDYMSGKQLFFSETNHTTTKVIVNSEQNNNDMTDGKDNSRSVAVMNRKRKGGRFVAQSKHQQQQQQHQHQHPHHQEHSGSNIYSAGKGRHYGSEYNKVHGNAAITNDSSDDHTHSYNEYRTGRQRRGVTHDGSHRDVDSGHYTNTYDDCTDAYVQLNHMETQSSHQHYNTGSLAKKPLSGDGGGTYEWHNGGVDNERDHINMYDGDIYHHHYKTGNDRYYIHTTTAFSSTTDTRSTTTTSTTTDMESDQQHYGTSTRSQRLLRRGQNVHGTQQQSGHPVYAGSTYQLQAHGIIPKRSSHGSSLTSPQGIHAISPSRLRTTASGQIVSDDDEENSNENNEPNMVWIDGSLQPVDRIKRRSKLPLHAILGLRQWFKQSLAMPYPSATEKQEMADKLKLDFRQVHNWFSNTRKRLYAPFLKRHGIILMPFRSLSHEDARRVMDIVARCSEDEYMGPL